MLAPPPAPPAVVRQVERAAPALPPRRTPRHRRTNRHEGPRLRRRPVRGQAMPIPARSTLVGAPRPAFTPGQLSAVGSVEKRRKWLLLGGHGRNGPG